MKTYAEAQFTIVRQIQAERRAEAAANRIVTDDRRRAAREGPAEGIGRFQRVAAAFRVNRAARA
jgi:hypothetical protein